jgi:hypothetical protein
MEFKALTHKMERVGDGQFSTAWSYRCDKHRIEEVFKEGFFNTAIGNLLPGDTVRVTEIKDDQVTATIELMVISKSEGKVDLRPMSRDITRFEPRPVVAKVEEDPAPPQFVKSNGEVKWTPSRKLYVVRVDGKEVAAVKDKDEAHSIARGDMNYA